MVNKRAKVVLLLLTSLLTIFAACTGRETVEGLKIYPAGKEYSSQGLSLAVTAPFDYTVDEKNGTLILRQVGGDAYFNENYSIKIETIHGGLEPMAGLEDILIAELAAARDYEERSLLQPVSATAVAGANGAEAALIQVFNLNNEFIKKKFLLLKRDADSTLIIFTSYNQITPDFNRNFEQIRKSIKLK